MRTEQKTNAAVMLPSVCTGGIMMSQLFSDVDRETLELKMRVRAGSWTGPPREKRAPRVEIPRVGAGPSRRPARRGAPR